MQRAEKQLLYLCGDRGIPFGGFKGASVHVREFLETLPSIDVSARLVVARRDKKSEYKPGYPVHLIDNSFANSFLDSALESGLESKVLSETREFCRNEPAEKLVEKLCVENNTDVIYERYSLFGIAGYNVSRRLGIPHILEVNAPLVIEASRYRDLTLVELAKSVEKILFSSVNHIVAVSEAIKSYILGVVPEATVTVVPNGVNLDLFQLEKNGSVKSKDARKSNEFVIGFVGTVKPWHGLEVLIDAFALLSVRDPSARLRLVGKIAGVRNWLDTQCVLHGIEDKVVTTGPVVYDSVPSELSQMDVLVAPYPELKDFYFSPLKLYEYMATGKPIVASQIGQIKDLLKNDVNALLVPPGDSIELCAAIWRLRSDPDLGKRLANAARDEAEQHHSWARRLVQVRSIIDDLTSAKKVAVKA